MAGNAIEIPLTRGRFALVDEEDREKVSGMRWQAHCTRGRWCATRSIYRWGLTPLTEWMHLRILPPRPGFDVDHINGNALDNRKSNLRYAPRWGNGANRRKQRTRATSKYKGVCWNKGSKKWRAEIRLKGKAKFLGYFADETQAARAYDAAAKQMFGEFALPNFL